MNAADADDFPPIHTAFAPADEDWFASDDGGGYVVGWGKFRGRCIRDIPLWWLVWMREREDLLVGPPPGVLACSSIYSSSFLIDMTQPGFKYAFDWYYGGLRSYAETDPGAFIIPFGLNLGRTVIECDDIDYMVWVLFESAIPRKPKVRTFEIRCKSRDCR